MSKHMEMNLPDLLAEVAACDCQRCKQLAKWIGWRTRDADKAGELLSVAMETNLAVMRERDEALAALAAKGPPQQ